MGSIGEGKKLLTHRTVHPHVRGEHTEGDPEVQIMIGSSPRAWGACGCALGDVDNLRFIPTCVGSIAFGFALERLEAVHPHVRGEHINADITSLSATGSSPRAWGASTANSAADSADRFIPTCVGSIKPRFPHPPRRPVHPHVRGEHARIR